MKYSESNKPLICMQTNSTCYKNTSKMQVKGVLWHSTGANNPSLKRYVQPSENDPNYDNLMKLLGDNPYNNDWNHVDRKAGLNCWVGKLADGTVTTVQTMPWDYKPWGCGSGSKGSCNNTHVQFEICEDSLTDRTYFEQVYNEACEITAYICDMYNLDPHGTVNINGVEAPVILCHADSYKLGVGSNHGDVYNWFKRYNKTMEDVRNDVAKLMGSTNKPVSNGMQAVEFKNLDNAKVIEKVGPLFTADQKKSGILASVSLAQFILESGYGKSELGQEANNMFGMKCSLSGNTWAGSTWDGSKYTKQTGEYINGEYITVYADFRKYTCVEDSIADHSAYLLGAKKDDALRYAGIKGETDYKVAIQIIKDGGYATSPTYVNSICDIIERWNLTKYDIKNDTPNVSDANFKIGDEVKLISGATYVTGKDIPSWVFAKTLYVRAINGNNITISTLKTGAVTGVVASKYLTLESNDSNNDVQVETPNEVEFKIGDEVKLLSGATYTSGKNISSWVFSKKLYVRHIDGNKVTVSTLKTGAITGVVYAKDLIAYNALSVGDTVKLTSDATYYNGSSIPSWVFKRTLYVREVNGEQIVISTLKTGAITGIVNKKHLTKC